MTSIYDFNETEKDNNFEFLSKDLFFIINLIFTSKPIDIFDENEKKLIVKSLYGYTDKFNYYSSFLNFCCNTLFDYKSKINKKLTNFITFEYTNKLSFVFYFDSIECRINYIFLNKKLSNILDTLSSLNNLSNDEKDPTFYYLLYTFDKNFEQISKLDFFDDIYIKKLIKFCELFLNDNDNDHVADYGNIDFIDFLKIFKSFPVEDCYGGNGCYSYYLLQIEILKNIIKKFDI